MLAPTEHLERVVRAGAAELEIEVLTWRWSILQNTVH
jgi:hypothetical protein